MLTKRAIKIGILSYLVSAIFGVIISAIFGVDFTLENISPLLWYLSIVVTVIIGALFTLWYFNDPKTKPSAQEGLKLGIVFVIIAFIIEGVGIAIYLAVSDTTLNLLDYYKEPLLWVAILGLIGAATLVGYVKGRK